METAYAEKVLVGISVPVAEIPAERVEEVPEIWSVRLSLLGAGLGVPAIMALLVPSVEAGSLVHTFSYVLYGIGMLSMFFASAAFHEKAGVERSYLKNLDYCAIGLMLAGSFTPFCTIALGTLFGYAILAVIWTLALGAIILRLSRPKLPKKIFIFTYLAMGWLGMLIAMPLFRAMGMGGIFLTVAGGVIYTTGTLVFNRNEDDVEPPGWGPHDVWHIFIILGAGLHWLVYYLYMLPA